MNTPPTTPAQGGETIPIGIRLNNKTYIRFRRITPCMDNDLRRWQWDMYRPDNTIGRAMRDESYTKLGGLLKALWVLHRDKVEESRRWTS